MNKRSKADTLQVKESVIESDKRKVVRNRERPLQRWRLTIQLVFVALCLWIGVEFFFFVRYLESGGATAWVARPPGAEAFLPISSLMSLYYFFLSGEVHPAHPAGLFILVAIFLMSLTFGKTFCSWVCPFGLLSESLADLGEKIMGRRLRLPRVVDYLLRSLKYLLLAFFLYAIFFVMGKAALRAFLDSPYNQVADVKMYYFFAQISSLAFWVIAALVLLSIFIRNSWCRFLCPYGALLGILGLFSPAKIKRSPQTCIDCTKCAKVCPSLIKVDQLKTVLSDECTGCLQCVDACPVANTLQYQTTIGKRHIPKKLVPVVTIGVFIVITGLAMLTGRWQNDITPAEYLHHKQSLESYGHPTDTQGLDELNEK
ncbi:MAG: 4Fe-4S binding protein [bacterium]